MRKRGFHHPLASLLRQALRLAQGHEREAEWLRTHASLETQSALRKHKGHCQDLPRFHKMADTSELVSAISETLLALMLSHSEPPLLTEDLE